MVLLISYDLRGAERPSSWDDVRKTIEVNSMKWARPLYSQWFVQTQYSPKQWTELLKPVTDENDRLFICEIGDYWGWLPEEFWEWLRQHS